MMQNKKQNISRSTYEALTPEALNMLQAIAETGSFAAAARKLDLVPSALTYRVRQLEDALDVLLFDRSSRQAKPTDAGRELLREGMRLLDDMNAIASRIKRIATGWEAQLTISVDTIIAPSAMMELCEAFLATNPPPLASGSGMKRSLARFRHLSQACQISPLGSRIRRKF